MNKALLAIFIAVCTLFLFLPTANAGKQELTKDTVAKAWAKNATQGEFCKVTTSADDIKTFSGSLLVGSNADEDKFLANIHNLPCTSDVKKIIYGTLRVERVGVGVPDESLEQVFVIDDLIVRPVQYYADLYKPGENIDLNASNSVYGAVKGVRSFKASLTSPIEGTGVDAGYYVHVDQNGMIDGLYVLYKNDLYRFTQSQKEITDLILVDYTADTKKSETPTSSVDETADWKIYEGKNFSISYPSNWIIDNSYPDEFDIAFKSSDYTDDGGMPITTSGFKVRLAMNREVSKNPSKLGIVSSTDVTWLGKKAILTQKNYEGLYYILRSDSGSSVESSMTMVPASEAVFEKNKADFLKAANSIILK